MKIFKQRKAITDKIVEILKQHSDDEFDVIKKRVLNNAVETIKRVEREAEFEEVARVMIKYLHKKHNPHVTVIITPDHAELLEGLKSTGKILDYIKD